MVISGSDSPADSNREALADFLRAGADLGKDIGGIEADDVERSVKNMSRGRISISVGGLTPDEADALMDLLDEWRFRYELVQRTVDPEPEPTECSVGRCDEPRKSGSPYCEKHAATHTVRTPPPLKIRGTNDPQRRRPTSPQGDKVDHRQMICPHCQTKGKVTAKEVKVKRGIHGGKATGAVLTGGLSLFATGLSRKEGHLEARCSNCGTTWLI